MEVKTDFIFQVNHPIITETYANDPNYLIEELPIQGEKYCVIYFSSNDLYYPNNEIAFQEQLLRKNKYEWYKSRIEAASKHIFIRDIKKQWYLNGINKDLNSPQKLLEFLKVQTRGFKVIALGASAGGYAAVLYGQMLNAERIFSFNGQFELNSLLNNSYEEVDPIIFANFNNPILKPFYDTTNFISNPSSIFYFHSLHCTWDIEQNEHVKNLSIKRTAFQTSNHGIPFLRTNLPAVLNMSDASLEKLNGKTFHPLIFSLKLVGFLKTMQGIESIVRFGLKKAYIKTILKLKAK